jgi:hypothetical protein
MPHSLESIRPIHVCSGHIASERSQLCFPISFAHSSPARLFRAPQSCLSRYLVDALSPHDCPEGPNWSLSRPRPLHRFRLYRIWHRIGRLPFERHVVPKSTHGRVAKRFPRSSLAARVCVRRSAGRADACVWGRPRNGFFRRFAFN